MPGCCLNFAAKVIIFFLLASVLPNNFGLTAVKIYYFRQNKEIIAQSVDVWLYIWPHVSHFCECCNASLGTPAYGAGHVAWLPPDSSRQHENLSLGQQSHHRIYLLLEVFHLTSGQDGLMGRAVSGLWSVARCGRR